MDSLRKSVCRGLLEQTLQPIFLRTISAKDHLTLTAWGADSIAFFYEAARVIGTNGTSLDTFRTLSDSLDRSEKEDDYEQNHI